MEIIVEDILISNLIMNFVVLFLTKTVLSLKTSFWRVFFAALLGSVFSVVLPMFILPAALLLFIKLLFGAGMILLAFKYVNIKKFALTFLSFLIATACLGGISYGLLISVFGQSGASLLEMEFYPLQIALIYGSAISLLFITKSIIKAARNNFIKSEYLFGLELTIGNKQSKIKAYLDTGHTLVDPLTDKPIIVLSAEGFEKLFGADELFKVLQGKIEELNLKNCHYITVGGIGKSTKMLVFELGQAILSNSRTTTVIPSPAVGLGFVSFKKLGVDALINNQIFG